MLSIHNSPAKVKIYDSNGNIIFEGDVMQCSVEMSSKFPGKKVTIEALEELLPTTCIHKWKKHKGLNAIKSSYQGIGEAYEECTKCGETK